MKIAALTLVRNDTYFLEKWIAHYGAALGHENLFIIFRGTDWAHPPLPDAVSKIVVTGTPHDRSGRNEWSAEFVSATAAYLLHSHDAVLRADVDEFVVMDPACGQTLAEGIADWRPMGCVSALGTDVIHHRGLEAPLGAGPVLSQRRHGIVTREFSKPVIIYHPVRWQAGFHRADAQHVRFAPGLHLFHLALHDETIAQARVAERAAHHTSDSLLTHVTSRLDRFDEVTLAAPIAGDEIYDLARRQLSAPRPHRGPRTRPGFITDANNVPRGYLIHIPDRFHGLI